MLIGNQPIKQGLESSGFTPTVQPLKEFEDDYGFKAGEGDDEESEADSDSGDNGENDEDEEHE